MRKEILFLFIIFTSCTAKENSSKEKQVSIIGTWELVSSQKSQNDRISYDDLTGKRMIKVINTTHFAFMNHDLENDKDSLDFFVSGGGKYTLTGDQYTEYLEYCNFREWEGNTFTFTVEVKEDSLIQHGIEKVEELNVDRKIIEKYVRTNK